VEVHRDEIAQHHLRRYLFVCFVLILIPTKTIFVLCTPIFVRLTPDARFRCNNERPSTSDCNWVYHESFYSESPLHSHHKNTLLLNPSAFFDNWPPSGGSIPELTDLRVQPYDGKWHHAAYVKEGSSRKIRYYLDGQHAATEDWEPYQGRYATTLNIVGGHRPKYMEGSQSYFEGFMWDLYVWLGPTTHHHDRARGYRCAVSPRWRHGTYLFFFSFLFVSFRFSMFHRVYERLTHAPRCIAQFRCRYLFGEALTADEIKEIAETKRTTTTSTVTTTTVTRDPLINELHDRITDLEAMSGTDDVAEELKALVAVADGLETKMESQAGKIVRLESEMAALQATANENSDAAARFETRLNDNDVLMEQLKDTQLLVRSLYEWQQAKAEPVPQADSDAGGCNPVAGTCTPVLEADGTAMKLTAEDITFSSSECTETNLCELSQQVASLAEKFGGGSE